MHIVLAEPYFTGSHKNWAKEYAHFSAHDISILSLPGRFWKWRMHGGAVSLAQQFLALPTPPDMILASDMLDLTTFLALTRRHSANIPVALYFHENQLTYPWSPTDRDIAAKRDSHYSFINYASALAADVLFFNSDYHLKAFFEALPRFLKHFPDFNGLENIETLRVKSSVLSLGLNLRRFDSCLPLSKIKNDTPLILWNHRWEYDKNPATFFDALYALADNGIAFDVAILGENFRNAPQEFEQASKRLGKRIVHFGFAKSFADYAHWLARADILPVTSIHDYFGISVAEAIYCGAFPLLPNRLNYPALIPPKLQNQYLYDTPDTMLEKLQNTLLERSFDARPLQKSVSRFDWSKMARIYDETFLAMTK